MIRKFFQFILLLFSFSSVHSQNVKVQLHSHNDFEQEFPLSTASSYNFKSIEVDVFEFENKIVVSHDDDNLHSKSTLAELYLEPLSKYSFKKNQSVILLIDLKMGGSNILIVLHQLLEPYPHLCKNRNDLSKYAPVQVILSGSVDKDFVLSNDSFSYFFLDGRVDDLMQNYDSSLMPLISSDFEDHFCWKLFKKITKSNLKSIISIINKAHAQNKLVHQALNKYIPKRRYY